MTRFALTHVRPIAQACVLLALVAAVPNISLAQPRRATPATVPAAVAIPRPSTAEVEAARQSLAQFLAAADSNTRMLVEKYPGLLEVRPPRPNSAIVPNLAPFFRAKHEANLEVARQGDADILFMGDSITDFWRNSEGNFAGKPVLDRYFGHWVVANFGIAGDTTQGVLYRLQNGEGTGISPRAVMLMIGTNIIEGVSNLHVRNLDFFWNTGHQVAAVHGHIFRWIIQFRNCGSNFNLNALGASFYNQDVVLSAHVIFNVACKFITSHTNRLVANDSA
jgi:hypothetical protein